MVRMSSSAAVSAFVFGCGNLFSAWAWRFVRSVGVRHWRLQVLGLHGLSSVEFGRVQVSVESRAIKKHSYLSPKW